MRPGAEQLGRQLARARRRPAARRPARCRRGTARRRRARPTPARRAMPVCESSSTTQCSRATPIRAAAQQVGVRERLGALDLVAGDRGREQRRGRPRAARRRAPRRRGRATTPTPARTARRRPRARAAAPARRGASAPARVRSCAPSSSSRRRMTSSWSCVAAGCSTSSRPPSPAGRRRGSSWCSGPQVAAELGDDVESRRRTRGARSRRGGRPCRTGRRGQQAVALGRLMWR